jgi:hypothetical protein
MGLPPGPGQNLPRPPGQNNMPSGFPMPPGSGQNNLISGPMIPNIPPGPPMSMPGIPPHPSNFKAQMPSSPNIIENPLYFIEACEYE